MCAFMTVCVCARVCVYVCIHMHILLCTVHEGSITEHQGFDVCFYDICVSLWLREREICTLGS